MGQLSHREDVPFPIFDADNHLYEPPEALTKFLPKEYKDFVQYVQINGRTKIAIRGHISNYIPNPTFEVVARPGAWEEYFKYGNPEGKTKRELFGEPMRAIPAFFEPGPRLEKMNELGLDRTLMFPTLASLLEERLRDDPVAIHVLIHALNQWLDEVWGFNYQNRIFTTPVITLPIVEKAIEELEWAVKRGARCILVRPAPVPGFRGPRSFALPEFDPFWERVVEHDLLVGMHSTRQRLLPVHLRVGRCRTGDAAVPNQCDGHPQRVAADPGRGGVVGDSRRAVPPSQAEGRDRRGRFEVDDPVAGRLGRGLPEGPGSFPERPSRNGQEPNPRQPVLRGRHRRSGQPRRCEPGAVRLGLAAPGRAGGADVLRQRAVAPVRRGSGKDHGRQPRSARHGVTLTQPWRTIPEMVLSAADRFGDAEAVVDGPLRLTFTELVGRIRCAAGAFADLGIDQGDRVAIWAPNSAEWIIAAFGLLTAGGVLVPVNTRFKTDEAGDIIVRSGAKAVLVQKGFLDQDYTVPAGIPVIDLRSDFLSAGSPFERAMSGSDISDIIFTSGTTGRPKGAMMNHQQTLRMYEEWATLADLREGDRYLQINPYFHTFGLKAGLITSFLRGATILPVAVFDVDTVVDLIERERITMLPGPPTLYHSLLTVGDKSKLSTLRAGVTGAADIPVELVRRIHGELPFQTLMTGYGLTEAGNVTLSLPGDSFEDVATTAGVPCDGVEVRIADDGEVLVRGYGVMQGYLDDPDATAQTIDGDGWLHTGDLGNFTEAGRLRIVGRKKDMFIVGGFNAYPAEIEGFLLSHPAVAQAAVVGVPDERLGQVGKAFIVRTGPIDADELIGWCRDRMAGFKVPRSVQFLDALPLNATGKVVKNLLR